MQRHAQLMYTSCGWFFDDISGIETVQIIAYAARVLQLAKRVSGKRRRSWSRHFSRAWRKPSRTSQARAMARKSTKRAWQQWSWGWNRLRRTTPSARSSLRSPRRPSFFAIACAASPMTFTRRGAGGWRWDGRMLRVRLRVKQQSFSFAVLHFGDQNITAAVKPYDDANAAEFEAFAARAAEQVRRADFPGSNPTARQGVWTR